jgi:hypothetical protein
MTNRSDPQVLRYLGFPICCQSFLKVFQDPLPAGLPPERSEGHSISTELGHPPPFRSMYRLSLLEYRELEEQVTKFLKDGIPEVSQSPYGAHVLSCVCVLTIGR